jgi:glucokinase
MAFATLAPYPRPSNHEVPTLSSRPVLALDLGATQMRAAVVLPDGERIARFAGTTPVARGPEAIVEAALELLGRARAAAVPEVAGVIDAVGVATPGPVDPERGIVLDPPNLGAAFHDVALAAHVAEATGLETFLDRDTNVAALAEGAFGAAAGSRDYLYLTISSGIGGAVVTEGRLLTGPDGTAGELGHVAVDIDGPLCGCGARGHLEAIASGVALATAARDAVRAGRSPYLATRAREVGPEALEARDVAAGDEAADRICRELMDRARHALAAACVGFANVFDPERIVIGGAIAEHQGERLLGPVRAAVSTLAFRTVRARTRVVAARLGADVVLAGAQPLVASRRVRAAGIAAST